MIVPDRSAQAQGRVAGAPRPSRMRLRQSRMPRRGIRAVRRVSAPASPRHDEHIRLCGMPLVHGAQLVVPVGPAFNDAVLCTQVTLPTQSKGWSWKLCSVVRAARDLPSLFSPRSALFHASCRLEVEPSFCASTSVSFASSMSSRSRLRRIGPRPPEPLLLEPQRFGYSK